MSRSSRSFNTRSSGANCQDFRRFTLVPRSTGRKSAVSASRNAA